MGVGEYKGGVSTAYLAARCSVVAVDGGAGARAGGAGCGVTTRGPPPRGHLQCVLRSRGCKFLLRVKDTDVERSIKKYQEAKRLSSGQTIEKILWFPVLQLNKLYRRNMILRIGILNLDWINCTAYLLKRYHQMDQNICFTIYIFQDHFPAPTRI